jgi:DNA segregation ATPase FtsK/SpoIIIE, S-DNA-T family
MNIPHHVIKTVSNDFATQIYILSDVQIKTLLSSEREIAKRMHLENKNLTITVDKSYFVFDIRNSLQKVYYFDEYLKKVKEQQLKEKELPFLLGIRQSTGEFIIEDLADMLSSLVAGARGNGKSVFVNVLIQSLMSLSTKEIIFVLADFKGNECIQYKDFKNCLFISSHDKFINILNELIKEMELRYKKLGKLKNLKDYNENAVEKLPYIVVIIDEMACISLCDEKLSESINLKLMDLLNRGRASGIIIIGAMQRPSSKQIDTNVRANLDAKISFRVSDKKETSFTETPGAEKLNRGEFIINAIGYDCERIQSLFIDDKERNFIFEKLEKKFGKGGKKDGFILNLDK